ncbi:MAG: NADPH-dependent FMN reductase [Steroidobacteraceae bacterium]
MQRKTVLLIMGSTRAGRKCPQVAAWVESIGHVCPDFACEIVDLASWPLPMDDEPDIPALGHYAQAHTRAWSDKVKTADAVVFVTPQFNWGYPAVLKNAIDHLYYEWRDKPAVIVTYGGHGGTRCARQLRRVAASLKMRVVTTTPALTLPDAVIRQGARLDADRDFVASRPAMQRAFIELADQLAGRENILSQIRRHCKAALSVVS